MKVKNFFQVNDWEIKDFSIFVITFQILITFLIILSSTGVNIPIIRPLVGFIYLTFIPGLILLRILRLHNIGNIEVLLYSVGLSLSSLMFIGFLINIFYPLIGISHPLSFISVVVTVSILVLVLLFLSVLRDKNYSESDLIDLNEFIKPSNLFLFFIPFLAIFGSYLVNFYQNNIILMLLILVIGSMAILIGFTNLIPKKSFPLAVFVIAFSLLLHRSLVPYNLWGNDIQYEYYFAKLVLTNGYWNWNIPYPYNGVLSTNILAPIYTIFCNLDIKWIFKIVYQFIFSLVPLGLYLIFKKQTNEKIAFFSCFFFVSISTFYMEMTALARQEIAELFIILVIFMLIQTSINRLKTSLLFVIFSLSVIISHYSSSYIYVFIFTISWLILYIIKEFKLFNVFYLKIRHIFEKLNLTRYLVLEDIKFEPSNSRANRKMINLKYITFFTLLTIVWYLFVANSSSFMQVLQVGNQIVSSLTADFLNPNNVQGLFLLTNNINTVPHIINRIIQLISQFFIIIGLFIILISKKINFKTDYIVLSAVNLLLLFLGLCIPFLASSLNTTRLYHLSLILLAPFCIIGGLIVFNLFNIFTNSRYKIYNIPQKALSVFLVINLLFASGFVYETLDDHPTSNSLSQSSIIKSGTPEEKVSFYSGYTPDQNVISMEWLSKTKIQSNLTKIYSGSTDIPQIWSNINSPYNSFYVQDLSNLTARDPGAYIYLGYLEVNDSIIGSTETKFLERTIYVNLTKITPIISKSDKIYSNGNSKIYYGV